MQSEYEYLLCISCRIDINNAAHDEYLLCTELRNPKKKLRKSTIYCHNEIVAFVKIFFIEFVRLSIKTHHII